MLESTQTHTQDLVDHSPILRALSSDPYNKYALILTLLTVIYPFVLGFWTMRVRISLLDKKILKKELGDLHKKYMLKPGAWGYPDMGNGLYSDVLSYEAWYKWNLAMRLHMNTVENLAVSLVAIGTNWYFCPKGAVLFGSLIFVTRLVHNFVYWNMPVYIELASRINTAAITGGLLCALIKSF